MNECRWQKTGLRDCSELYQFWSYNKSRGPDRDIAAEHRKIAEHTLAKDEDGAATALTQHIQATTDLLLHYLNGGDRGAARDGA